LTEFEGALAGYVDLRGTLAQGPERLLAAFRLEDQLGQLSYRLWYYAGLTYDQDQRDNSVNARRQRVQILFAKAAEARSWFTPELLRVPLETVRTWMGASPELAVYRFAVERVYHQQAHVLDEKGELLLSLASRFGDAPHDIHSMGQRRHNTRRSSPHGKKATLTGHITRC
jgi:oligoendopeptidase F